MALPGVSHQLRAQGRCHGQCLCASWSLGNTEMWWDNLRAQLSVPLASEGAASPTEARAGGTGVQVPGRRGCVVLGKAAGSRDFW